MDLLSKIVNSQQATTTLGVVIGGVLVQVLNNRQKNMELGSKEGAAIRKELQAQVLRIGEENHRINQEHHDLQERYYVDMNKLKDDMHIEMNKMKDEMFKCRSRVNSLEIQLSDIKGRGWIPTEEVSRYQ